MTGYETVGAKVRARVAQAETDAAQRRAALQARSQQARTAFNEQMHQSVQHAEAAWQNLGSHVIHEFNGQADVDRIRGMVESALTRARAAGANVQNTGGQTRVGRG